LGAVMLAVKCRLEKRFDRWFATAFGILAIACITFSAVARTHAWSRLAATLAQPDATVSVQR
jgi:hypothetical protein